MRLNKYGGAVAGAVFSFLIICGSASASPWAAVGDMQLRNDVEILARHGVISGPVNSWPISWKQITRHLSRTAEMDLPPYVRLAVMRVKRKIPGELRVGAHIQATNNPKIVRGFEKTARNDLDAEATLEYNNDDTGTTLHLQGGYREGDGEDYAHLDGSYLSQDIGNWALYAGAFDRWWGPGRESTLILSNNARPMPSVGLRRIEPKAFASKWLSWMGPWSWDMFVARMEEDRHVPHALIAGMRLTFAPMDNFEVGLSRTLQLCGEGRPCDFETWGRALIGGGDLDNNRGEPTEPGNQLASIDLSYTFKVSEKSHLKIYGEGAAEDEAGKLFLPFQYARLVGATLYGPYGDNGARWRLTAEHSDTSSTHYWLFGRRRLNVVYEHFIYRTGYRFKGRSLGHSLDSDSRLMSVTADFTDAQGWEYQLKYHNALINRDDSIINSASIFRKKINIIEANVEGEMAIGKIKLELRLQDDQPNSSIAKDGEIMFGLNWSLGF